jgi:hypothetical protein
VKTWLPKFLYDIKPWAFIGIGAPASVGAVVWSVRTGEWTGARGAICVVGAVLAIFGGAILQMRREYRARSKWYREKLR